MYYYPIGSSPDTKYNRRHFSSMQSDFLKWSSWKPGIRVFEDSFMGEGDRRTFDECGKEKQAES
jgi:hypothetical protein